MSAVGQSKAPVRTAIEALWSIEQVSTFLQIPVGTLYQWRCRGFGPPARKAGRRLRYDPAEVRAWLARQAA
jgi:predicted DNA-binding transcriptional regulator AlpA